MSETTPESTLNIAAYIIQSSPTGEVHEVIVDVAKLVNDSSVLNDAALKKIMKTYNEKEYQPVKTEDGNMVIVSGVGCVADNEYVEPSTGRVFKFDHRKHAFEGYTEKKQSLAENIANYRTAIEAAMEGYKAKQYKDGKCVITVYGADDGSITICLSARNVRLSSFWGGGWQSTFTLNVKGKGSTEMKGKTNVNVHYFEEGNVQLHAAIEKTASINVTDEKTTASAVAAAVQTIESDFQTALEEMYIDMHNNTFKAMRRFLPVTKQPMKWSAFAHSIVQGQ